MRRLSRGVVLPFLSAVVAAGLHACGGTYGEATSALDGGDETSATSSGDASGGSSEADGASEADGGCSGAGCPCSAESSCTHPVYATCVNGRCAACTTEPDSCPVGRFCLAPDVDGGTDRVNECAPGCKSHDDCRELSPAAPLCDLSRHRCVACLSKNDCAGNKECTPAGACADQCTASGGTCPNPNEVCCSGLCVDTKTDIFNCNGCGIACTGGQTLCCNGVCANPLTDAKHCGACGSACSTTNGSPSCLAGSCRWSCNPGFHHCVVGNTGCETHTANNVAKCGDCETSCTETVKNASGVACVDSKCTYNGSCSAGHYDGDNNRANGCEAVVDGG